MRPYLFSIMIATSLVLFSGIAQAACTSPAGNAGELKYDSAARKMAYCNSLVWVQIGAGPKGGGGCASPTATAGAILFDSTNRVMKHCNGQEWAPWGVVGGIGSGSGCTSPTGVGGALLYNSDYRVLQYCDGKTWEVAGSLQPTLQMDFTSDDYTMNGTSYASLAAFLTATSGTFTRASTASYFNVSGVLSSAASGAARLDYDPVTHDARGILMEESRTNLIKQSAAIDNASWNKAAGISVTANATTAPDGTVSAESVSPTTAANSYVSQSAASVWSAGQTITRSVYAKAGVGSTVLFEQNVGGSFSDTRFDLATGTVTSLGTGVTASIQNVGNGWYRLIATRTWVAASGASQRFDVIIIDDDGGAVVGNNVYLWGAQIEIGPNVTSYIPTVASTVTRAVDVLTVPTPLWYNANMGTFFAETYGEKNNNGTTYSGYVIGVGSGTDKNLIDYSASLSSFEAWCNGTDPAMVATFTPAASPSQSVKVAFAWNATGTTRSLIASGGSVATGSYGSYGCDYTAPSIRIGGNAGGATLNAPIKQIQYYPFPIPTAELQTMVQQ